MNGASLSTKTGQPCPAIDAFFERLAAKEKSRKPAVIACMGKLLRIVYGLLSRGIPFAARGSSA
jgi:hypothetical protein